MIPEILVGYIQTLSSGNIHFIKYLGLDQLELVRGAYVHQELTSLSTGVMVLKKNMGNNIQGYFHDLWNAVNDLEEDLDQKTFGITSLNNVVNNLNITDLQRKITKVEATVKFFNKQIKHQYNYWKVLGEIGCHLFNPMSIPSRT